MNQDLLISGLDIQDNLDAEEDKSRLINQVLGLQSTLDGKYFTSLSLIVWMSFINNNKAVFTLSQQTGPDFYSRNLEYMELHSSEVF